MRLTTLTTQHGRRVGIDRGDHISLLVPGVTMLDVIAGGSDALADLARAGDDVVELEPGRQRTAGGATFGPLLDPPSVRDFLTYEQHLAELAGSVPDEWYEKPLFYFSNAGSIVGAYEDVRIPPLVTQYDYELEIAAVVGASGADLTPAQAVDHIFGYTIFNDWSARDLQVHEFKFPMGPSKSKDGSITLGAWLVTADELADSVHDGQLSLNAEVLLNGARVGGDNSANMSWTFPDLVAYASRAAQVRPGDVLASGTCATGCLAEIKKTRGPDAPDWLQPGDVVRIEVEQLGFTENALVPGPEAVDIPRGRRRLHPISVTPGQ